MSGAGAKTGAGAGAKTGAGAGAKTGAGTENSTLPQLCWWEVKIQLMKLVSDIHVHVRMSIEKQFYSNKLVGYGCNGQEIKSKLHEQFQLVAILTLATNRNEIVS